MLLDNKNVVGLSFTDGERLLLRLFPEEKQGDDK